MRDYGYGGDPCLRQQQVVDAWGYARWTYVRVCYSRQVCPGWPTDTGCDSVVFFLLTVSGWTSRQIAEAFGVREDTVRFWRSAFMTGGIEALKTAVAPGPMRGQISVRAAG